MLSDLDALMKERGLDTIVVDRKVLGNPPLIYLLNGAVLGQAIFVKRYKESPHIIVSPLEREEAIVSGYEIILTTKYDYIGLLRKYADDPLKASVIYYQRIFDDLNVSGRVGWYGFADQGHSYTFLNAFTDATPDVEIVGEFGTNLINQARITKDADEVAKIQEVGRRTTNVVRQVVDFLRSRKVDSDEVLHKNDGSVLTVGDVHNLIQKLIAREGLEDPEQFVFSTGRDSGIPHSIGSPEVPIRLGKPIIFDIYPRKGGSGYFFDITRTFCLGYAPDRVWQLYEDVRDCLMKIKANLRVGEEARAYQQMTCAHFQERGHNTVEDDPKALHGYLHNLGHGIGLDVHEPPWFRDIPQNITCLAPGHVFAIEPGLYYPDEEIGVRLEDVIWIDENSEIQTLTDYPYTLVVPMIGETNDDSANKAPKSTDPHVWLNIGLHPPDGV